MRDRPRSIARPPNVQFRSVLVGDSFLEGYYIPAPLAALVERRWVARGLRDMEAINLAIAATGPRQYYARIKKVALALDPDVVAVFVYAGNDMMDRPFDPLSLPPLIDELPAPSLLGAVAPRTTWLVANRLRFSEVGRANKDIPGEDALLNEWTQQPSAEPVAKVARHMRLHYFPEAQRGGDRGDSPARGRPPAQGGALSHARSRVSRRLAAVRHHRLGDRQLARPARRRGSRANGRRHEGGRDAELAAGDASAGRVERQASAGRPDPCRNRRPGLCRVLAPLAALLFVRVVAPMQDIVGWRRRCDRTGCRWWTCARSSTAFVEPIA